MATDIEAADREVRVFLAGKRQADAVAALLREVLAELGITVGDKAGWPRLAGRASMAGEPTVYLGSVLLGTADRLADALIRARLQERRQHQRATGGDGRYAPPPAVPEEQRATVTGGIAMADDQGDHKGPPAPLEPLPLPNPHPDGGPPPGDGGHRR